MECYLFGLYKQGKISYCVGCDNMLSVIMETA